MATFTNGKSGEVVQSTLTNAEAAAKFAANYGDDHWLMFWLHKYANAVKTPQQQQGNGEGKKSAQFLGDLFVVAIGYGLKRPMIRLHYKNQRFKIYLSQRGTLCIKSGFLAPDPTKASGFGKNPVGDEFYIGYIAPQGYFRPATERIRDHNGNYRDGNVRPLSDTEREFLAQLSADPINFMAQCSKDMCRCCYCNQPLEDERSKAVGYGSTCAKHWGLPYGDKAYAETAPSFPKCYNQTIAAFCAAIKQDPSNQATWLIFADALEEAGLPRCKPPAKGVVVPRMS